MNKNPNARFTVSQVREMLENQMDDDTKNKFVLTIKQENAKKDIVEEQKSSKIESKTKQKIHDYTETLSSICSIA
jgi:DNA-binding transcriptional MerR regulator